jgi:cell division protein FtsI/penicillin-binding protein 2
MTSLYAAIVNEGKYYLPTILEGTETQGVFTGYPQSPPTKAMTANTAATLKEFLENTLKTGTGGAAYTEGIPAGGKRVQHRPVGRMETGVF